MQTRNDLLARCKRIVIKVGTNQISEKGAVSEPKLRSLCEVLSRLQREAGRELLLVSSGAIAAGIAEAGLQEKKRLSIPYKQAAAAIGQTRIMKIYTRLFGAQGIRVGQVLLTRDVICNRRRYLNAGNTLSTLLKLQVLPIINENDTVATEEIEVGDNDRLAAMVAQLSDAQLLILLSDVDGFFRDYGNKDRQQLLSEVAAITPEIRAMAGSESDRYSTGGMVTKLDAAELCMHAGIHTILANGADPGILQRVLAGEAVGTLFRAEQPRYSGRKLWIVQHLERRGTLEVDAGARTALQERGTSLLPSGITAVRGNFEAGDGVSIQGPERHEFAIGISNYGREDLVRVMGHRSREIPDLLGYRGFQEAVHRDNLVLLRDGEST